MNFGEYIAIIHRTDCFIGGEAKIAADLFDAAGSTLKPVSDQTTKHWISGHRKCNIREHFPNYKLDEKGFTKYFSSRESSWTKLQAAFLRGRYDCIVDVTTNKPTVFYRSLLNQFQKIFKLPETEEPAEQMLVRFKEAVLTFHLEDFFTDPLTAVKSELSVRIEGFFKRIDDDIFKEFSRDDSKEATYKKIKVLSSELELFTSLASISKNWSSLAHYRMLDEEIVYHLRRVVELYGEICGITTSSNIRLTIKSPAFPDVNMNVINYSDLIKKDSLL